MEKKKIYQILPVVAHGDGVSQQAFQLECKLREIGYQCETYADSVQGKQIKKKVFFYFLSNIHNFIHRNNSKNHCKYFKR